MTTTTMPASVRARTFRRSLAAMVAVSIPLSIAAGCTDTDDSSAPKLSAEGAKGQLVARERGCLGCHSADGSDLVGPTWKNMYGSKVDVRTEGKVVTKVIDAEFIRRAVRTPNVERPVGAQGQMPTFDESRISDAELDQVIAYLQDLSTTSAATTTAP